MGAPFLRGQERSGPGTVDAESFQLGPEPLKDLVETAIEPEGRVEPKDPGHFGHGDRVFKPNPEEQAILGMELVESPPERRGGFSSDHRVVGGVIRRGRNRLERQFIADQVSQSPTFVAVGIVGWALRLLPTIPDSVVVQAESPGHNDEPSRERPRPSPAVGTQAPEVVPAKPIQHPGVPVHYLVLAAAEPPSDIQQHASVIGEKPRPRVVLRRPQRGDQ